MAEEAPKTESGGIASLLVNPKVLIVIAVISLIQFAVWYFYMNYSEKVKTDEATEAVGIEKRELLSDKAGFIHHISGDLAFSIGVPSKFISMNIALVVSRTQREINNNVAPFTTEEQAAFEKVLESLTPHVRDRLNDYLIRQSADQVNTDNGLTLVKQKIRSFYNELLANVKTIPGINRDIDKERIKEALITNIIIN